MEDDLDLFGGPGTVLVAEDDDFCRRALERRLKQAGHTVLSARDGREAWQALLDSRPEVVVSDWLMPSEDGYELCRKLKSDPDRCAIYLILLTALDGTPDKVAALDAGADDYLTKPCDEEELLARVRTGLRAYRMQSRLRTASFTDALTGLKNRRYFDERLLEEVARARRYGGDLSLLLADLDGFKRINDRHGHPAGDAVLAGVGALFEGRVRASDVAARLGGDEYAVLLPQTPLEGAEALARSVRERIGELRRRGGPWARLGLSTGCAVLQPGMDAAGLLRAADRTLYACKRAR